MKCPKTGRTPMFMECYNCNDSGATADDLWCNITGECNGQMTPEDVEAMAVENARLLREILRLGEELSAALSKEETHV